MITFICIFYYLFSLFFMIGYVLTKDEWKPLVIVVGVIGLIVLAPILFPLNLGTFISRNSN